MAASTDRAPRASLVARLRCLVGSFPLDVELDSGPGTLALVGANGAGKTSTLLALLGALPVESGRIEVGTEVLLDTSKGVHVPVERRRLGYVPQDYALFPHLTVRANVAFGLPRASAAMADGLLADLGIEALAGRFPSELSGGEGQKVALARALAPRPRALLLDEPLSALDVHGREGMRGFLASWLRGLAIPAIVVTHDAREARSLAERIAVIEDGRVTQCGTWEELEREPASSFVRAFVASAQGGW